MCAKIGFLLSNRNFCYPSRSTFERRYICVAQTVELYKIIDFLKVYQDSQKLVFNCWYAHVIEVFARQIDELEMTSISLYVSFLLESVKCVYTVGIVNYYILAYDARLDWSVCAIQLLKALNWKWEIDCCFGGRKIW